MEGYYGPVGQALVLASLLFATVGCVVATASAISGSQKLWRLTQVLGYLFGASMIGANADMIAALVNFDFSVSYVAEVGNRATPVYYTVTALWASLHGSILLWGGVLGIFVVLLLAVMGDKHREYMPWTMAVLLGISIFFAWLVGGTANPFVPTIGPIPLDGPGPNPLLQNHALMAFHPPALYGGYVGMAVPFAMGCAALFAGRIDAGWMRPMRIWMLIPWVSLTIGIVMGGWWSYEVLGWGGYWAWDPVENASFHPWLTATAFLHSAMLLERRGIARMWSLVLLMATFVLTLIGTFMTRSGVFNSVHAFTQSEIGPIFLKFIAFVSIFCVVLLTFRVHLLDGDEPASGASLSHPVSREFSIIVQNLLFTAFTFVVLLGTSYPLITEYLDPTNRVSVGEPFFDSMSLPLGVALIFMMGVGPALPWGRARDMNRLLWPLIGGVALAGFFAAFGFTKIGTVVSIFVAGYALASNLREMVEPAITRARQKKEPIGTAALRVFSRTHRRFGGQLSHLGVVMAVVAIALSKGYKVQKDFVFNQGDVVSFNGYDIRYTGSEVIEEPNRDRQVAYFAVQKDGQDIVTTEPSLNTFIVARTQRDGTVLRQPRMREPIGSPDVYSTLTKGDLYFSLLQVAPDKTWATARVMTMPAVPWLWIAMGLIAGGGLICALPAPTVGPVRATKPVAAKVVS